MALTAYPEIDLVLEKLASGAHEALGEQLVGLYVGGSLAGGDFNPQRSDIDFIAATAGELSGEPLERLREMHANLTRSGLAWAGHLEGAYLPLSALRRYDPAGPAHPVVRWDGSFDREPPDVGSVFQRWTLRECGLVLAGPPPAALIDPVTPADLRQASLAILWDWWAPMLTKMYRLPEVEYQAYAALTMCRVLYTLETGTVVSKPVAVRWAKDIFGPRWAGLIDLALAWPEVPQPDRLEETKAFIRETLERSKELSTNCTNETNVRE